MVEGCSLAELHESVPAAEEEDLLEDLDHERNAELFAAQRAAWSSDCSECDAEDETETDDRPERLSPGQVIGLVEHMLGATPLESTTDWDETTQGESRP